MPRPRSTNCDLYDDEAEGSDYDCKWCFCDGSANIITTSTHYSFHYQYSSSSTTSSSITSSSFWLYSHSCRHTEVLFPRI